MAVKRSFEWLKMKALQHVLNTPAQAPLVNEAAKVKQPFGLYKRF
jgi:hypothetical protein